jgi:hypothetical protein
VTAPFAGASGAVDSRPGKGKPAAQSDQTAYKTQLHSVSEMHRMLPVFEIARRDSALRPLPSKMAMVQSGLDQEPSSRKG